MGDPGTERQAGWQYIYFAAELRSGLTRSDQHASTADFKARHIDDAVGTLQFLRDEFNESATSASTIEGIFAPKRMTAAFGAPGHDADPEQIRQVASDVVGLYERLGLLSQQVQATELTARFQRLATLVVRVNDELRQQVRDFIAALEASVARIPEMLRMPASQRPEVRLVLQFEMDRATQDAIASETRYLAAAIRED